MSPRPESLPIPEHWSEKRKDIHRLIKEFREHLTKQDYHLPYNTEGVVVLSAPPEKEGEKIIEKTQENITRVEHSIDIIKQMTAQKVNKPPEEITTEDIIKFGPPLILNGETEQLPHLEEIALEAKFPKEKIQLLNCGDRGIGNTKTQFEQMNQDSRFQDAKHLTYVTTSHHVPRAVRTANKNLNQKINFEIIGIPYKDFKYDVFRKVSGEVKRILAYSEKDDISKNPKAREN